MNCLDLFFSRKLAISMEGSTEEERNKINVLLAEYPNKGDMYFPTVFSEFNDYAFGKAIVGFFSHPFLTYITKESTTDLWYKQYQIVTTKEFLSSEFENVGLKEISESDMFEIFEEGG